MLKSFVRRSFFSLFNSIFLHRALVLPADQDDPRSPETELLGRLEAQARGAAGHYHAFPSQAKGDKRGTTGLTKCYLIPCLAVTKRAFHKMFQCEVHKSPNHTKY